MVLDVDTAHCVTAFVQEHAARAFAEMDAQIHAYVEARLQRAPVASPLEAAFLVWWEAIAQCRDREADLVPQYPVCLDGHAYRLDFAVIPFREDGTVHMEDGLTYKVAIELDGHAFHERSPAQVERRNQRDRELTAAGWRLLHFSGSEFHRDPLACIEEVRAVVYRRQFWGWEPCGFEP